MLCAYDGHFTEFGAIGLRSFGLSLQPVANAGVGTVFV